MLYDMTLRIEYGFGGQGARGRQLLRLLPKSIEGEQRVIAAALDMTPGPSERRDGTDFFGNTTVETAHRASTTDLDIIVKARVRRTVATGTLDLSPPLDRLAAVVARQTALDARSPHHFTGTSPRIQPDPAITRYARRRIERGMSVLEAVAAVNAALFEDMRFDSDATDVSTPAREAFALRHGVCQDFSHIMITALRALGIPAGYVSGLLRTRPPKGQPRLEGADAMHAWVMAWCGEEAGWVEFDPTNGVRVANDHVVIAHGRDYADVAPVTGLLTTNGPQHTDQAVDLIALEP